MSAEPARTRFEQHVNIAIQMPKPLSVGVFWSVDNCLSKKGYHELISENLNL